MYMHECIMCIHMLPRNAPCVWEHQHAPQEVSLRKRCAQGAHLVEKAFIQILFGAGRTILQKATFRRLQDRSFCIVTLQCMTAHLLLWDWA